MYLKSLLLNYLLVELMSIGDWLPLVKKRSRGAVLAYRQSGFR